MNYSRFVMTGMMLTIFTVMVAIASQYPAGARFMVFVVGFPAIALCLLQLVLDLRESRNGRTSTLAGEVAGAGPDVSLQMQMNANAGLTVEAYTPEVVRREIIVWGFILALIGSILLFGFYISVPIFLVAFLRFFAKASWRMAILLPAGVSTFLYLVFTYAFRMTLHLGFITEYVLDRISG